MSTRSFQILAKPSEFCYEEKRSRFIAFLWPIETKEQGFIYFNAVKNEYPDARHYCWAYILGDPEQALSAGFNDDGEPGGTAGKPMLNVLFQRKIGNVFALVVRYFGGIKLGAGGLTRAYGQAVSGALDAAEFKWLVPSIQLEIEMDFALEQKVRNILSQHHIEIIQHQYNSKVLLSCLCPIHLRQALEKSLNEQTSGRVICKWEVHRNQMP
jgi:uncharacterized YigZ family protein